MYGIDRARRDRAELLKVCQLAYRKHQLEDNSIGWRELDEQLHDALETVMGFEDFDDWAEHYREAQSAGGGYGSGTPDCWDNELGY